MKNQDFDDLSIPDFLDVRNRTTDYKSPPPIIFESEPKLSFSNLNKKPKNKTPSSNNKTRAIISELEGIIDDVTTGLISEPDFAVLFISKDLPATTLRSIVERYEPRLIEVKNEDGDPDIKEGYRRHSKEEINTLVSLYSNIIEAADRDLDNRKRLNSIKANRKLSVTKIISKVKYLKYDADINLSSLSPDKVVNTHAVVTYDKEKRLMKILYALDGVKLSFKGTTIKNVDLEKSIEKKIRKPDFVVETLSISKSEFYSKFNKLSTKANKVKATRTNEHTLFLRVEK